ncbi:putative LTR transposable element, partial [Pseudoloma neurophilia]
NKHERNWGITEKELFAIIEGLDKFRDYTHGKKYIIISDHKALTWLQSREDFGNQRIQRWLNKIIGMDFEIRY